VPPVSPANCKRPHTERRTPEKRRRSEKAAALADGLRGPYQLVNRRDGMAGCRYRGLDGMKSWVGFGVLADNLINISNAWPWHGP